MEDKAAFSINEVVNQSGLSRTTVYEAMNDGSLIARKHGRRVLILRADLLRWLEDLPTIEPA